MDKIISKVRLGKLLNSFKEAFDKTVGYKG